MDESKVLIIIFIFYSFSIIMNKLLYKLNNIN